MSRPAGNPPNPAGNATYPPGTDPWSSTPTKVDPGLSVIAAGFVPDERLPAQVLNFLENAFGIWVGYQDKIEALNFRNMGQYLAGPDTDKLHISDANNVLIFNEGLSRFFFAGRDATADNVPKVWRSASGSANSWVDDGAPVRTPGLPSQTYQVQNDGVGRLLGWITESDSSYFYIRSAAGSWGSASVNQPTFRAFVARFYQGKWVVGGGDGAFGVIYVTDQTDTWTAQTLASPVASDGIVDMAFGGGHIVAVSGLGNVWHVANLGSTWGKHAVGSFASKPTAVVYVNPENLFWILCEDGEVYTSTDANSWTLAFTPPSPGGGMDPPGFPGAVNRGWAGAAAFGGMVVASVLQDTPSGTVGIMGVGWNGGTQWTYVSAPIQSFPATGSAFQVLNHLTGDGRLVAISENGASSNGCRVMFSLRV